MGLPMDEFVTKAEAAGMTCRRIAMDEYRGVVKLPCAWHVPICTYVMVWLPDELGCITLVPNTAVALGRPAYSGIGRFDSFEFALASLSLMEGGSR